jgi:hypothetical protein
LTIHNPTCLGGEACVTGTGALACAEAQAGATSSAKVPAITESAVLLRDELTVRMFDPPVEALMLGGSTIGALRDVTGNTNSTNRGMLLRTPLRRASSRCAG